MGGKPHTLILADQGSGIKSGDQVSVLETEQLLADQILVSPESVLLVALQNWRRMLVYGPEQFGEVAYFGSVPLISRALKADPPFQERGQAKVLLGLHEGAETRFYFDPESYQLLSIEVFADEGGEPCEVHFFDYQTHDELMVPSRIQVAFGNDFFRELTIEQIEFLTPIDSRAEQ